MSNQLPTGDLTSPTTFMNNTHIKLEPGLPPGLDPQQQYAGDSMNVELGLQDPNEYQQQYSMSPAHHPVCGGGSSSMLMQQDATAAWPAGSGDWGFPTADSVVSHASTELPGLPRFDFSNPVQSSSYDPPASTKCVDATENSMGMPGMHPGALPQIGASSPRCTSSPALAMGVVGNHCAQNTLKHSVNGHSASQREQQPQQEQPRLAQQYHGGSLRSSGTSAAAAAAGDGQQPPVFRSQYRGVSYDKKKRKWRVQIKVAALGKSGVSVGYFDTEDAAARAYDRAAIGLLGRPNCRAILNFPIEEYDNDSVPELVGKSREEVKATLKSERAKMPRRRLTNRRRTSRYLGVGSSNRKNQWQARILYHGKVTHLGYYRTEEEAARVYDKVSISLHGAGAQTNFPIDQYKHEVGSLQQQLSGLTREELQRALGVKPMDKSSTYRGVSKKKGRWEAKVMLNRKWAYRELFDTEHEAARAYDVAVWRLKPREARNYANFKDSCPPDVADALNALDKDQPLEMHPTGLPVTAKPLIEAGLLFDDEGQSIRAPNGMTRAVSIGDLVSLNDSAQHSTSEPSAGNGSNSAGARPAHSGGGVSGGAVGAVAGAPECVGTMAATYGGAGSMVKSASYSALSGLEAGAVTSNLAMEGPDRATDPAAAAAAPVSASSFGTLPNRGLHGELATHSIHSTRSSEFAAHTGFGQQHGVGMPRVQSVPQLSSYHLSDAGSPSLPPASYGGSRGGLCGLQPYNSGPLQQQQYQFQGQSQQRQQQQQQQLGFGGGGQSGSRLQGTFWTTELAYQDHRHQQQPQQHTGMRMSRSCGNLALMGGVSSPPPLQSPVADIHSSPGIAGSPRGSLQGTFSSGSGAGDFAGESKPLMVRVGSEQHLINPNPTGFKSGMSRIASESHLSSMVPVSPSNHLFVGPERPVPAWHGPDSSRYMTQQPGSMHLTGQQHGSFSSSCQPPQQQHYMQQPLHQQHSAPSSGPGPGYTVGMSSGCLPSGPPSYGGPGGVSQHGLLGSAVPGGQGSAGAVSQQLSPSPELAAQQGAMPGQQQQGMLRRNSSAMHRAHSFATLASIDETLVYGHHFNHAHSVGSADLDAAQRSHSLQGMQGITGPYGMHQQQQLAMHGPGHPPHSSSNMTAFGGMHPGSNTMGGGMLYQQRYTTDPAPAAGHQFSCMPTGHASGQLGPGSTSLGSGFGHSAAVFGGAGVHAGMNSGMAGSSNVFTGPASAPAGFGVPAVLTNRGASGGVSAAAAAKAWGQSGPTWGEGPDSPLGNVQIGGEDLDVAMAFLADGSPPRRLTESDNFADALGLGMLDPTMRLSSPMHSNSAGALLFDNAFGGDLAIKMED